MDKQMPDTYYAKLEELQAVDFVLVELTLYLDTHPGDGYALQQYNQMAGQRMQLAHEFQMEFGPLMAYGHAFSKHPWQWWEAPWPWQV